MAELTGYTPDKIQNDMAAIIKEDREIQKESQHKQGEQQKDPNHPILSKINADYHHAFTQRVADIKAGGENAKKDFEEFAAKQFPHTPMTYQIYEEKDEEIQRQLGAILKRDQEDMGPGIITRNLKLAMSDQEMIDDAPQQVKAMISNLGILNAIKQDAANRANTPLGHEADNEFNAFIETNELLAMCPFRATPKPEIVTTYSLCARDTAQTALVDLLDPHNVPAMTENEEKEEEKLLQEWLKDAPVDAGYGWPKGFAEKVMDMPAHELERCYIQWGTRNWPTLCQADIVERVFAKIFGWLGPDMGERIWKAAGPISYLLKFIPVIQDMWEGRMSKGESLRVCLHLTVIVVGIIASAAIDIASEGITAIPLASIFWKGVDLLTDATISWVGDSVEKTYFTDRVPWADRFTPGKEYLNDHWKQLLEWRQWIEEEENDKKSLPKR